MKAQTYLCRRRSTSNRRRASAERRSQYEARAASGHDRSEAARRGEGFRSWRWPMVGTVADGQSEDFSGLAWARDAGLPKRVSLGSMLPPFARAKTLVGNMGGGRCSGDDISRTDGRGCCFERRTDGKCVNDASLPKRSAVQQCMKKKSEVVVFSLSSSRWVLAQYNLVF